MITIDDDILKAAMQGVIDEFLIPKFISLGMNASGKWIESLEADAVNGKGYIRGQYYSYWLKNGRAPSNGLPPYGPIFEWVGNKLGLSGAAQVSATWAVRQKIKKEGTNYYPDGTDLLDVLESNEVNQYIYSKIKAGVAGKLTVEIKKRIKQTLL